ncbi:MAG: aspartyl/asparaginyl beta-hydroxylase domain-containing protein, partial [Sphingomonadaceae bacterium]|nr:aspartyl/asparaginyl beta-hydroxylase domain-containing protein [Sphingomonadaceae bacterium]
DAPQHGEAWLKLASIRRARGDRRGALDAISGVLRLDPLAFVPLLMKASLLEALGEDDAADELYGAAAFQAPPDEKLSPALREQLGHARTRNAAFIARREAVYARAAGGALNRADPRERKRIERFQSNALRKTEAWHQQPTHFHFPGLAEHEFFDRAAFPFLSELEAQADAIRTEFEALIASEKGELVPYVEYTDDVPGQMAALNRSLDWTAIHLIAFGERVEANARHCPRTLALFEGFDQPQIAGRSPNLMFSLLAPRTRIPPHHGVSNARVVLHLPLIVPPGCGFRVGGEARPWVVGEGFVFDDTIEHEAWNDSDRLRVVLIGDLWRPELTPVEREAVTAIIAASAAPTML